MSPLVDLELRLNPRILVDADIRTTAREMKTVGSTPRGIQKMLPKGRAIAMKLYNLTRLECNILKQTFLSLGGDVCVHKEVITEKIDPSHVVLVGMEHHFAEAVRRMGEQPWKLSKIAEVIHRTLKRYRQSVYSIRSRGRFLRTGRDTIIMGVLNVTPDSFSDGGRFADPEAAVRHALAMKNAGADIIDVGGESTRPGSRPVSASEEKRRVLPVIRELARHDLRISIDTSKAEVARAALDAGAGILNDVTALRGDRRMAALIARRNIPVILMHMKGTPGTMQTDPSYADLMGEITFFLRKQIQFALDAGISHDRILVDPGIGFGKTPEHNLEILKRLGELRSLGHPIVVGTSRKSFIGRFLGRSVEARLNGTAATVAVAILRGAHVVRVHDVSEMADVARMTDLLK